MESKQALNILYQAAQQARLTADDHASVREAAIALQSMLEKEEEGEKEKKGK